MSKIDEALAELLTVDGAIAAAAVDAENGMMLGQAGSGIDLELAAAGNTEVVCAKLKTMKALKLNDVIEDILIALGRQYHIIRPTTRAVAFFSMWCWINPRQIWLWQGVNCNKLKTALHCKNFVCCMKNPLLHAKDFFISL